MPRGRRHHLQTLIVIQNDKQHGKYDFSALFCTLIWKIVYIIGLHRVFKKSSSNGKITVYLGKRDFVDHITHVDPIDGVVLIDPDYVKERKVFGNVLAAFRYGREDLDVLGLTFRKDLYLAQEQVHNP